MDNAAFKMVKSMWNGIKKADDAFYRWDKQATFRLQEYIASGISHEDAREILQKETIRAHEANKRLLPMAAMLSITLMAAASLVTYAMTKDTGERIDNNQIGVSYNLKTGETSLLGVSEASFDSGAPRVNQTSLLNDTSAVTSMGYIQKSDFNEAFADIDRTITTRYIETINAKTVFSSGEVYDPTEMVIAYPNLPIDTIVKLTTNDGSYAYARVADFGPSGHNETVRVSAAIAETFSMDFIAPETVLKIEIDQEKTVMANLLMVETGKFQTPKKSLAYKIAPQLGNDIASEVDEELIVETSPINQVVEVPVEAPEKTAVSTPIIPEKPPVAVNAPVKLNPTYSLQFGAFGTQEGAVKADSMLRVSCSTVVPTQKIIIQGPNKFYTLRCLYNTEADARKAQSLTSQETVVKPLTSDERDHVKTTLKL